MKKVVLLLETSREFGRQLIIGITRYSRLNGPWSFYKEQMGLKSSIPHLTNWKPNGIIMRNSMIKKELLKLKVPTILALHDSKIPKNMPVIRTNSKAISKTASTHLINKGLKNFAFFGFDCYEWSNGRKLFFGKFNQEAGFQTHNYDSPNFGRNYNWQVEQQAVIKWVKSLPKPVGIMACNDDRGQHLLEVCKLTGLKVPDDVAVIGVDNDPIICELGDPPLTSIALNIESAGYETAKLLDALMNGENNEGQQIDVIPTLVVQRQSTDILAVNDSDILKALKFIKENAVRKINVDEIVNATNVGRRVLERKFKEILRATIYNELKRVRIEMISKMLLETDMQINEIISHCSFVDIEHISRFFKKEKGIGLSQFRNQNRLK